MNIQDNFLNEEEFTKIKEILSPDGTCPLPWALTPINTKAVEGDGQQAGNVTPTDDKYNYYISHLFYSYNRDGWNTITSEYINYMRPLVAKLRAKAMMRLKVSVYFCKDKHIEHGYHQDFQWDSTTSIFYVNTNNGYTKFEDGTIVESVANRVVTFPTPIRHTSLSQTDTGYRITINCNYM